MYKIGLLVYDYTLFGGAEKVALKQANEFVKNYEVHFISCFAENESPIMQINENVKCFVLSKKVKSLTLNAMEISSKLKKYLNENNIDVLISITAGVNTIAVLATWHMKTKMIYAEHSNLLNQTYGKKHQFRQWIGAKAADRVVTLTEADRAAFINKYGVDEKCSSIYNWYDGKMMSDAYDDKSRKIITVGRLVSVKGYDRLIRVATKVLKKYPTWIWEIYGQGPMKKELEALIKENELEKNVFLKGNRPDIMELYKEYAFFVMTSYYEGLPLVLLEAKSNLLPVVSFDCPTGPSEMITNGYDGFLIENGNIEEMVKCINMLIEDIELRKKLSRNSTSILTNFKREKIAGQWVKLINKLCSEEE